MNTTFARAEAPLGIMRTSYFSSVAVVFIALCLAAGLVGCEPTIDEEDAEGYAEDWSTSVEEYLRARAVLAAGSEALESRVGDAAKAEEDSVQRDETPFAMLIDDVYQERDYEPVLTGEQGLTDQGEAIWTALQRVEDHNLDSEVYGLDSISESMEVWEDRRDGVDEFDGLEATDEDLGEAIAWLVEQPVEEFELSEANFDELTTALVEGEEHGERLRQAVEEYQEKQAAIAEAASAVEKELALGLARYARQQRHSRIKDMFIHPRHWDYYNEPDVDESGSRPDPVRGSHRGGQVWRHAANLAEDMVEGKEVEILHERIRETVAGVFESDEPEERVGAIPPQQPQYAAMVEEFKRYRDIVEDGGWDEVSRNDNLVPGQSSETVGELKERLRVEGYFPEDVEIDNTFDSDLSDAIREYQETHQMIVDGRPNHVFWYSLNISAERRLAQIGLNLDRWRETNIRHSEHDQYVFVNIPDFMVEVYKDGERIERIKSIVGDNDKDVNPLTGEAEYANRTPVPMAAKIDRLSFNPYWNVTKRIRAVRILPQVRESIERKYALKINELRDQARAGGDDVDPNAVTLASITSSISLPTADADDDEPEEVDVEAADFDGADLVGEDDLDADDPEGADAEAAADSAAGAGEEGRAGVDGEDEVDVEELSDEEIQELRAELLAEKTEQSLSELSTVREVYDEEFELYENVRFFDTEILRSLESQLFGDDPEAIENFHAQFPYLDWETGEVDVESTDGDNVPSWYEANDYEVVHPGHHEWEYVRMLPSDRNSLGLVKIIFPNYDNIYLHDTPEKGLFGSAVRGFSHGCIRLEEPMKLSQTLMELGGVADENDIDQILADEEYLPVFLQRHIPVYLEYYTVRIDDEGRANFLADIYNYDDEELEESS